ncbi:hypothetical protein BOX15_Mlig019519g2 [Macrostomum lignano]|uniref:Adipocyte plasma membrane-associated protein n=3 Tax=Macrostomum lignano TaxID=282301 RepID=A0A1I8G7B8_9PLAT|nr:hypothetical protein BOX15_Mlig019519g2 [Macrostomum lignano]
MSVAAAFVFPGQKLWPNLQSLYFDAPPEGETGSRLTRCLVATSISRDGSRLELSSVYFLDDAQRWSQSPLALEIQFRNQSAVSTPLLDQAICCPDGCLLAQRVGRGCCHLLLADAHGKTVWQRGWSDGVVDLGLVDVEFNRRLVYLPHYAKGVVETLQYPDMQPSPLQLSHQRLVTAERVVAKRRYVAVEGFVLDNAGATVPGLAVFDTELSELLCATGLPADLRNGWSFTVTDDGRLMLAESQVDRDTNRFRVFGYTRSGDLDYTVKLLAALPPNSDGRPRRLHLVRDNLGRDFIREEDRDIRLLVPIESYLRKERVDGQRLTRAKELAMSTGFPHGV